MLASFFVFLKGFQAFGGTALGTSAGKAGSLPGSEAPGRASQQGLQSARRALLRWCRIRHRRPLANLVPRELAACIHW